MGGNVSFQPMNQPVAVPFQQDNERARLERQMRMAQMLGQPQQHNNPLPAALAGLAQIISARKGAKAEDQLAQMDAQQRQADLAALQSMDPSNPMATIAQIRDPKLQELAMAMANQKPQKRQIVTGPDGIPYDADTQQPILPPENFQGMTVTPKQAHDAKIEEIRLRDEELRLRRDQGAVRERQTDEQITLQRESGQRIGSKLSAASEKELIRMQDNALSAGQNAIKFEQAAQDYLRLDPTAGVAGKWQERLKEFTGEEDAVTSLRKRYTQVRNSAAIKDLPPGIATDKDIALALEGYLPPTANPQEVSSFLKGMAKMERIDEAYSSFAADYIDQNNGVRGLLSAWKKSGIPDAFAPKIVTGADESDLSSMSDEELEAELRGLTQ